MATECKQALNELALILASLGVFLSEESEGKWAAWVKVACKPYPGCLAATTKEDIESDLRDLQKHFNAAVKMTQTFGFKIKGSRAFGQSILVVVPDNVASELEKKEPTGLLASYRDADSSEEFTFS